MLSGLLYPLNYRPAQFQFPVAKEFFNPEPTPKAFGAALPIELPTRAVSVSSSQRIFQSGTNPESFGAALPIELPTPRRASLCNAPEIFQCRMTPLNDLSQTQMHFRRGA